MFVQCKRLFGSLSGSNFLFEKLSNVLLYCFLRLEQRSPGSRKQYGLVIDGSSLSLVFKGPYTGKSIVFVGVNGRISSSRMAAFTEARYRTQLCTHRNIIYTYERLSCRWFFLRKCFYLHLIIPGFSETLWTLMVLFIIGIIFRWFFWSVWTMLTRLSAIGTYIHIHKLYFPLNSV